MNIQATGPGRTGTISSAMLEVTVSQQDNRHDCSVMHDGKHVLFRRVDGSSFMKARRRYHYTDSCPLCGSDIKPQEQTEVVLLVSTQVGIPNRILHGQCFDELTPEYAWNCIHQDWIQAQKYKHWFALE